MDKKASGYEIDMVSGPLFSGILWFALPLALSGVLQLAFNAADVIVLGKFAGNTALAAVGATGALINLIVNAFNALSIGVNVMVANYRGAKQSQDAKDTVHTAMLTALIGGIALVFVGIALARVMLQWMATPDDVIDQAVLYMRIYFIGMPFLMVYNFGAAVLRAIGDTQRPLYFLLAAGVVNVVLNLFFVLVLHMDVAGVALATIISQGISAALIVLCLLKEKGDCHLDLKKLKIHPDKFVQILRIGLPAGLQSTLFSISNVLIQSSVNSFGSLVMSGNTAAANIEGFVYTAMNSLYQASLSFTSQNYGAHNYKRIDKILSCCLITVVVFGAIVGNLAYLFGEQLLSLYTNDAAVIEYGMARMQIICCWYFLCGIMDVLCGSMRGMGYSIIPMFISLSGACLFRIFWIYTFFAWHHTQFVLYLSYPISWILTAAAYLVAYLIVRKRKFVTLLHT